MVALPSKRTRPQTYVTANDLAPQLGSKTPLLACSTLAQPVLGCLLTWLVGCLLAERLLACLQMTVDPIAVYKDACANEIFQTELHDSPIFAR